MPARLRNIATWLNDQLRHREWNRAELERRSRLSEGTVRKLLDPSLVHNFTNETIEKLAFALRIPTAVLYTLVSEDIPAPPELAPAVPHRRWGPDTLEVAEIYERLPAEMQEIVLRILRRMAADAGYA